MGEGGGAICKLLETLPEIKPLNHAGMGKLMYFIDLKEEQAQS